MAEWMGPVSLAVFGLGFLWLMIAFVRRSKQRRQEMFREEGHREFDGDPDGDVPEAVPPSIPGPGAGSGTDAGPGPEEETAEAEPEPEPEPEPDPEPEPEPKPDPEPGRVHDQALRQGMEKTSASFLGRLKRLFGGAKIDPKHLDDLEEALLTADVGVGLAMEMVDDLRSAVKAGKITDAEDLKAGLKEKVLAALSGSQAGDGLAPVKGRPKVILFVGVNGVGKTTTIGKIASKLRDQGLSVVLAAGDTFRAAAAEQLAIWADRTGAKIIRGNEGSDPASVIYNGITHAKETGADFILADTAGRLHTKTELMDEIKKVKRAAGKALDGAPDEVWLVVDATTGQNALLQAKEFHGTLDLSGVVLTKLDGTAKGGVVVAIAHTLNIPVRFVGVGEQADDLRPFDARDFTAALFGDS